MSMFFTLLQDSLESKNEDCRNFLSCLNESLAKFGSKLPVDARYEQVCLCVCGHTFVGNNLHEERL